MKIQPVRNKIPQISKYTKSAVAALMLATAPMALQAQNNDSFEKTRTTVFPAEKKEDVSKGITPNDVAPFVLLMYGLTYAGIVASRFIKKPKIEDVAKNFSEIFRRDISEDEAEKMCQRYKEIFDIKDTKEFQQTMFEQVKKDYGLEETKWDLHVKKISISANGAFNLMEIDSKGDICVGGVYVDSKITLSRTRFFQTIIHELNHAKQHQISYMADSDAAIEPYLIKINYKKVSDYVRKKLGISDKKGFNMILEQTKDDLFQNVRDYVNKKNNLIKEKIIEGFGTTKPNSLSKDSKEYDLGLKYIEGNRTYTTKALKGYYKQLIEQESFRRTALMNKSCDYFFKPSMKFRIY